MRYRVVNLGNPKPALGQMLPSVTVPAGGAGFAPSRCEQIPENRLLDRYNCEMEEFRKKFQPPQYSTPELPLPSPQPSGADLERYEDYCRHLISVWNTGRSGTSDQMDAEKLMKQLIGSFPPDQQATVLEYMKRNCLGLKFWAAFDADFPNILRPLPAPTPAPTPTPTPPPYGEGERPTVATPGVPRREPVPVPTPSPSPMRPGWSPATAQPLSYEAGQELMAQQYQMTPTRARMEWNPQTRQVEFVCPPGMTRDPATGTCIPERPPVPTPSGHRTLTMIPPAMAPSIATPGGGGGGMQMTTPFAGGMPGAPGMPPGVATEGAGSNQCPPGQFWDGRQCRGSIAPGAAGLISTAGAFGGGGGGGGGSMPYSPSGLTMKGTVPLVRGLGTRALGW